MSCYPALKPGVNFLIKHSDNSARVEVGTANFGITLKSHNAILFLQKATGQRELSDILTEIGLSHSQAFEIINPLLNHNLLGLYNSPIKLELEDTEDIATQVSASRCNAELNLLAWRNNLSPLKELIERKDKKILILGSNRLTFALIELFISIGYLQTTYLNSEYSPILANLIGATPFRMSDLGIPLNSARERIWREFSLNLPLIEKFLEKPGAGTFANISEVDHLAPTHLVISTSNFLPDQLVGLITDGVPHLQIGNFAAGKVELGPIVIPGKTPCYNCIALWKFESSSESSQLRITGQVQPPLELPAASVTLIAGLITSLVDNFFALEKSFLIGSSIVLNLLKPLEYIERFWQPNPRCGCLELI